MNLEESIVVINANLGKDIVKKLIQYTDYKAKQKLKVSHGLDTNIRNVSGYHLDGDSISDKVYFKHVMRIIHMFIKNYTIKFKHADVRQLNQVDLLKYTPNGKYEIHVDHDLLSQRTLTCIINLNEDYEGGDFIFCNPVTNEEYKRVKCKTGTIIFFPSSFLFPHKISPVTKGKRYSIVSWLI